jgi:ubiquinone biosynthesis protein UbiJ
MLPASPLIFFLNHLLKSASWAPPKLAPFVGSILQFHSGPFDLRLRVTDAGLMEPVADDLVPALVI